MIKQETLFKIIESELKKCKKCKGEGEIAEHFVEDFGELGQDVGTKMFPCPECSLMRRIMERVRKREHSNRKRKEKKVS